MKVAEWRGWTLKALKDIDKSIRDLRETIRVMDSKIDKVNKRLDDKFNALDNKLMNMRLKVASIGGLSGLIIAFIVTVLVKGIV